VPLRQPSIVDPLLSELVPDEVCEEVELVSDDWLDEGEVEVEEPDGEVELEPEVEG
jgi:hypothetical protein